MSTSAPLNSPTSRTSVPLQPGAVPLCNVPELISLATRGLVAMFDADKQLFCHRLLRTEHGIVREGLSPRYTIMTLLGLREVERAGLDSPFDAQAIYACFTRDTKWIQGIGDLGLLIWLTAAFDPERLEGLFSTFNCETALDRYSDAQEARTMELAWFLAGLAHAAETSPKLASSLKELAVKTYRRIEKNQGEPGLFGHMSTMNSLVGRLRGRTGSFADQVYPIYGMSKFAKAFHMEEPLGHALECATAICDAQGSSGQWWWLYDSRSGRVSSRYPVYSVHQHGMAPMGLLAVEGATGQNFTRFIDKGLRWIYGANELGVDMRDSAQNLIWRCVLPRNRHVKYWDIASSIVRSPRQDKPVGSLTILYEQRPYEFGWLLFALAKNPKAQPVLNASSI
jgi:hypothetical protein